MAHLWIRGRHAQERAAAAAAQGGRPELVPAISAHRRHRGPYTVAGTLVRALAPSLLADSAELVRRHDIEVLSTTPELRETLGSSRETLTSLAIPTERTRFYAKVRTARLSHGLTELLRDHLISTGSTGRMLVIDLAEHADPTDTELLTIMLRRIDPQVLTLAVGTSGGEIPDELALALTRYATPVDAPPTPQTPIWYPDPAAAYVSGDCVSDDPALIAAYESLDEPARQQLHGDQAARLAAAGEHSLTLGAIPFHLERSAAPRVEVAEHLLAAMNYCVDLGFYDATEDLGSRGRALIDRVADEPLYWAFTTKMTTSLAVLGRPRESEALYDDARAHSTNPYVHRQAAYATAMLYTRHHRPEDRDHLRARAWINEAIVIANLLGTANGQAFAVVFQQNGLALIEMHLGNLAGAYELVNNGLARLDRELGEGEHLLHRSVLLHNRAQVLGGLGRLDEALADLTQVSSFDPNYPEYHFDRANMLHRLGRDDEALAEYAEAIRLSPPFPEAHYNRADVLIGLGETERALADLDYVLELEPSHVDAYVNRAGLLASLGEQEALDRDLAAGLALDAGNPHLLCLLGQVHAESGRPEAARAAFDQALAAAPGLAPAMAGLAALAFEAGDWSTALEWLDRAVSTEDTAATRFNRAMVHRSAGNLDLALADLTQARLLDPDDEDIQQELAALTAPGTDLAAVA